MKPIRCVFMVGRTEMYDGVTPSDNRDISETDEMWSALFHI